MNETKPLTFLRLLAFAGMGSVTGFPSDGELKPGGWAAALWPLHSVGIDQLGRALRGLDQARFDLGPTKEGSGCLSPRRALLQDPAVPLGRNRGRVCRLSEVDNALDWHAVIFGRQFEPGNEVSPDPRQGGHNDRSDANWILSGGLP
jgi:hypothetical protein